jgi:hypothetical protein
VIPDFLLALLVLAACVLITRFRRLKAWARRMVRSMAMASHAPPPGPGPGLRQNDVVAVVLSAGELPCMVELSGIDLNASKILLEGKVFVDVGAGDWMGFYDWLRTSEGLVIGVRQYLDNPSVFPSSRTFRGVEVDAKHGVVCAFFGQAREFDESASCDQDFGDNRLLVADDAVAITFCRAAAID